MTTEKKAEVPGRARLKLYFETLVEGTFRENAEVPGESMTTRRAYASQSRQEEVKRTREEARSIRRREKSRKKGEV